MGSRNFHPAAVPAGKLQVGAAQPPRIHGHCPGHFSPHSAPVGASSPKERW